MPLGIALAAIRNASLKIKQWLISTFSGAAVAGAVDNAASFNVPRGIAFDSSGNLYVVDEFNRAVRKITPTGIVSVIATFLSAPRAITIDASDNIYITETNSINRIIKISPLGVTSFIGQGLVGSVDGGSDVAKFNIPQGITHDSSGNLYVCDSGNSRIRKITSDGTVSTLAGSSIGFADGVGTAAKFSSPYGICIDSSGNLYVCDTGNRRIRKITSDGTVSTFAGSSYGTEDGVGTAAKFSILVGMTIDSSDNLYVVDLHRIRKITPDGTVSTFAGTGVTGNVNENDCKLATFVSPGYLSFHSSGDLYVSEAGNHDIRKISTTGVVSTFVGTGTSGFVNTNSLTTATFSTPMGMVKDNLGNLYIADHTNNKIRKITPDGIVSTFAGTGTSGYDVDLPIFNYPCGITEDNSGNLYVADTSNHRIRKITPDGLVSTFAGTGSVGSANGDRTESTFNSPRCIIMDSSNNFYITDYSNNKIRKITTDGIVSTFADTGASSGPYGITIDSSDNLYVTKYLANKIIKIKPDGTVSDFAGSGNVGNTDAVGALSRFSGPSSITIDTNNNLYVCDTLNHRMRKILPDRTVSTFAGSNSGFADGVGIAAKFSSPHGITIDSSNNLYITDFGTHRIRKITPDQTVSSFAGTGVSGTENGDIGIAKFLGPICAYMSKSNILYIGEQSNGTIRKISNNTVSTYSGISSGYNDSNAKKRAKFKTPMGITRDSFGNFYVCDSGNFKISKILPNGKVVPFAGSTLGFSNGVGIEAKFTVPCGITIDSSDNLYVADRDNNRIRKITPDGTVSTFAGTGTSGSADGAGDTATFNIPVDITIDSSNNLYLTDTGNFKIRKITPSGIVSTFAGTIKGFSDGSADLSKFSNMFGISCDSEDNILVVDEGNYKIRKITQSGEVSTIAGIGSAGLKDGFDTVATFSAPKCIVSDTTNKIFVSDTHKIRKIEKL